MKIINRKKRRNFLSLLLVLIMTLSGVWAYPGTSVKASDINNNSDFPGIEVIEIDDIWDVEEPDQDSAVLVTENSDSYNETDTDSDGELFSESEFSVEASETYISSKNFSVYANDYMRQFLTDDEKVFYDQLDAACHEMLTTTKDAVSKEYSSGGSVKLAYVITDDGVLYGNLGAERISELTELFTYQNPQYYFFSYRVLKSSTRLYLVCYDAFEDGDERATVTEMMFTRIDGWVDIINAEEDDYAKEKKADDIICANTDYVDDLSEPYPEFATQGWIGFSQTAYSMVMIGKTVCAGYTKTFTMLMNACGILTVGVTSDGHAWNKIKLGGNWYNVDVTWNDGDGSRIYSSRNYLNQTDQEFIISHNYNIVQESFYDEIAPVCDVVFDETGWNDSYVPVTGVSFDSHDDIIIYLFDEDNRNVEVTASVSPSDATDQTYHMSIDNDGVAWFFYGSIYGANPGETWITVRSQDGAFEDRRRIICYDKFETPSAPDIESVTSTTVTVERPDYLFTYEYSMDKVNWQKSNVFTGLSPKTSYTFYIRMAGTVYYLKSDASAGTTVKTKALTDATISSPGINVSSTSPSVIAQCVTDKSQSNAEVEYRWVACNSATPGEWFEISPWTKNNEWLNWKPEIFGNYLIVCYARVIGNEDDLMISVAAGVEAHPHIKGKCQMPYTGEGGGYLIGIESYDNPNQSYSYEMLILDCTLYVQGLPAWTYTTEKCYVPEGNALWTIWQPKYGYYWTLFRVFDKDGNLIDEECYGFENIN